MGDLADSLVFGFEDIERESVDARECLGESTISGLVVVEACSIAFRRRAPLGENL